jgi:hypothetical protein
MILQLTQVLVKALLVMAILVARLVLHLRLLLVVALAMSHALVVTAPSRLHRLIGELNERQLQVTTTSKLARARRYPITQPPHYLFGWLSLKSPHG